MNGCSHLGTVWEIVGIARDSELGKLLLKDFID